MVEHPRTPHSAPQPDDDENALESDSGPGIPFESEEESNFVNPIFEAQEEESSGLQVLQQAALESHSLCEELAGLSGHAYIANFTVFDVSIAALNAYSGDENFYVHPWPTNGVVSEDNDPYLFQHVVKYLASGTAEQQMSAQEVLECGRVVIVPGFYFHYLQSIQEASRCLAQNPQDFREKLVGIVAAVAYHDMVAHEQLPIGGKSWLFRFAPLPGWGVSLKTATGADMSMALDARDQIHVVNGGYSFAPQLFAAGAMPQVKFVLHEKNPFDAGVLHKLCKMLDLSHVEVAPRNLRLKAPLGDERVQLLILPEPAWMSDEELGLVANFAKQSLSEDGCVVAIEICPLSKSAMPTPFRVPAIFGQNGVIDHTPAPQTRVTLGPAYPLSGKQLRSKDALELARLFTPGVEHGLEAEIQTWVMDRFKGVYGAG